MGTQSRMLVSAHAKSNGGGPPPGDPPLGFAVSFQSGRGLLSARERQLGPITVKSLALEIPSISFPFDVTGGADRFKNRRCLLRHLALTINTEALQNLLAQADLAAQGLSEVRVAIYDGAIELAGIVTVGDVSADFTCRASLLSAAPHEMQLVFYDCRLYGWLPLPASLLPVLLRRALPQLPLAGTRAGAWLLRPAERFVREVLPRGGWKVPDLKNAHLVAAEISRGQISVAVGPADDPTHRQMVERTPPAAAIRAAEGTATFAVAEEALMEGRLHEAYAIFRDAIDDGRGGAWVRERLLQIGASDAELAVETRLLAQEALNQNAEDVPALLALGAIAWREQAFAEAAARYTNLAQHLRARRERLDMVAAETAAGRAATPVDPQGALQAFERAAARAHDSKSVQTHVYHLRLQNDNLAGAAEAGERWVALEADPVAQAQVHCHLGHLYRDKLADYRKARMHFERALRNVPDMSEALEGLAETYAARGEPGRAATHLARLAEQAESSDDIDRIVSLNLRLGEIWHRWLHDAPNATARFQRVLDASPRNIRARTLLAELAEEQGDKGRARALYEQIITLAEDGAGSSVGDVVAANTRLANLLLQGPKEGIEEAMALLQRAVELDPDHRAARESLLSMLRQHNEWGRLIRVLDDLGRRATDPEVGRSARLEAARVELDERRNKRGARPYLEQILETAPADSDALHMLVPILDQLGDYEALAQRVSRAAATTAEPEARADLLYRLSVAQTALQADPVTRRETLQAALDANPFHEPAARALVEVLASQNDAVALELAYDRLATAATSDSNRAAAHLSRATILQTLLAQPEAAQAAAQRATESDPHLLQAWVLQAELLAARDAEAARQLLEDIKPRFSGADVAVLHAELAALCGQLGDGSAEIDYLIALHQVDAGSPAHEERLVQLLQTQNRKAEAATWLERFAQTGKGDAGAQYLQAASLRRDLGETDAARDLTHRALAHGGPGAVQAAMELESLARSRGDWADVLQALQVQLEPAAKATHPSLLSKILEVHLQLQDHDAAMATAERLLVVQPQAALGRWVAAQSCLNRGMWETALLHLSELVVNTDPVALPRRNRQAAFTDAAALALELSPELLDGLQRAFTKEFGATPLAPQPFGDRLFAEGAWERLVSLRQLQLHRATEPLATVHRRQVADVLHHKMDRPADAVPYYQQVAAAFPQDTNSRAALAEIYTSQGRWRELAELQYSLSHLLQAPAQAVDHGCQSARLYADVMEDYDTARQVLRSLMDRGDVDHKYLYTTPLRDTLVYLQMHNELVQLLEDSLNASPDPSDGRFGELQSLLLENLLDPARSLQWTTRMVQAFPQNDGMRRREVAMLASDPEHADAALAAMRAWANDRTGQPRAEILGHLAKAHLDRGDADAAEAALQEAVGVADAPLPFVDILAERATARGDWQRVLHWSQQAASLLPAGTERDVRLRRVIDLATNFLSDQQAHYSALSQLADPSPADRVHYAELQIQTGDWPALASQPQFGDLPPEVLLAGLKQLASQGNLPLARQYMQALLSRHEQLEAAWEAVATAWRQAGKVAELGRWRLEYANVAPPKVAPWLRLLGSAELAEADPGSARVSQGGLEAMLAAVDLQDAAVAWAVFTASQVLGRRDWATAAAAALETTLPDDDPRLWTVLRERVQREYEQGDPKVAAQLARRLVALGDASAVDWLERALDKAGSGQELLLLLTERAQLGGDDAPTLWTRIAALLADQGDSEGAADALLRVPTESRTRRWGELQYTLGERGQVATMKAAGATVCAQFSLDAEKAHWLRLAATTLWWDLGDPVGAKTLLQQAHLLRPQTEDGVRAQAAERAGEGQATAANRLLQEALAVAPTPGLYCDLAPLQLHAGAIHEAKESLQSAARLAADDADTLAQIVGLAQANNFVDIWLPGAKRLFALAPERGLEPLVAAYRATQTWSDLIDLWQQAAPVAAPDVAAAWLQEAAEIAQNQLTDPPRALQLLAAAIDCQPNASRYRAALNLAEQTAQPRLVLMWGEALTQLVGPSPDVLKQIIAAARAEEDLAAEWSARKTLVEGGWGNSKDKLMLARAEMDRAPAAAAALLQQAALEAPENEAASTFWAAAQAWQRAGTMDAAAAALEQALSRGLEDNAADALACELCTVATLRWAAAERVLERAADADWPLPKRQKVRLDLAQGLQEAGASQRAEALLLEARGLAPSADATRLLATLYDTSKRPLELAELVVDEAQPETVWDATQYARHLGQAALVARQAGAEELELRALQAVVRVGDGAGEDVTGAVARLLELAAHRGDQTTFGTLLTRALRDATPAQQAALALQVAPLWERQLNDPAAAHAMLLQAAARQATPELLAALAAWYTRQERDTDLVHELRQLAAQKMAPEKIDVLLFAGDTAAQYGASALAFEAYQEALAVTPLLDHAAAFCLKFSQENGRWSDAIDLLRRRGAASTDPAQAHAMLARAAALARQIGDAALELRLLQEATGHGTSFSATSGAGRVVEILLEQGQSLRAAQYVQETSLDSAECLELGLRVAAALKDAEPEAGAVTGSSLDQLMGWLGQRFPAAPAVYEYQLEQARRGGDLGAVLTLLQNKLAAFTLAASERADTHREAALLARQLNEHAQAVTHGLQGLEGPQFHLDSLLVAYEAALESQDQALHQKVVARAAAARQPMEAAVQSEAPSRAMYELLAAAHLHAGDVAAAAAIHEMLLRFFPDAADAFHKLVAYYTERSQWVELMHLYEAQGRSGPQQARPQAWFGAAQLAVEHVGDSAAAMRFTEELLLVAPEHAAGEVLYGMLLTAARRFDEARSFLAKHVDATDPQASSAQLKALLVCYRETGASQQAMALCDALLERAPQDVELLQHRAEILEDVGAPEQIEAAWRALLALLGGQSTAAVATVYHRLAGLAQARGDMAAVQPLLEAGHAAYPQSLAVITALRQLYEGSGQWQGAAALRIKEAALFEGEKKAEHYLAAADIYEHYLEDAKGVTQMLEKAAHESPRDSHVLLRLVERYDTVLERAKYLLAAERLLNLEPRTAFDGAFFRRLAKAYERVDGERAREFHAYADELGAAQEVEIKAAAAAPAPAPAPEDALQETPLFAAAAPQTASPADVAAAPPDWQEQAQLLQQQAVASQDLGVRAAHYASLAQLYLNEAGDVGRATAAFAEACAAVPSDVMMWRRLADAYALDPAFYARASEVYRRLLAAMPFDPDMLRIVARLEGQQGNHDVAYSFYACLWAIKPADEEAKNFVQACRAVRPKIATRLPTDAERAQGLLHPHQSGPIEGLFAPLARFAELTQQRDLATFGLSESNKLPADAPCAAVLQAVNDVFATAKLTSYLWPAGKREWELLLAKGPALLLGVDLAALPAGERQLPFIAARAAELYRGGHFLCALLEPPALQGLLAALCHAVDPSAAPQGATADTARWAPTIAAPMNAQLRNTLALQVQAYVRAAGGVDVQRWRQASIGTANRVALLMCCDVQEAVVALLTARHAPLDEGSRQETLKTSPQEQDLLRFAQSAAFFTLRRSLGVALTGAR